MNMFTKRESVPQLESKLQTLRAEHTQSFATLKKAISDIAAITECLNAKNKDLFKEDLEQAQQHKARARSRMKEIEETIPLVERALDIARTKPQREQSAKTVNDNAKKIEAALQDILPALQNFVSAVDGASYRVISNLGGNFPIVVHAFHHALAVAKGGAVVDLAHQMREHASLIVDGERPFELGANLAAEQAQIRNTRAA